MNPIRLVAILVLGLAAVPGIVHASPPVVEIVLGDEEHVSRREYPISEVDARSIEHTPRRVDELVIHAKSDFAQDLGYTRQRFGPDNWKVVSNLRVTSVALRQDSRITPLRTADMPESTHEDSDVGETEPAAPPASEPAGPGETEPDPGSEAEPAASDPGGE